MLDDMTMHLSESTVILEVVSENPLSAFGLMSEMSRLLVQDGQLASGCNDLRYAISGYCGEDFYESMLRVHKEKFD